jgi:XTP/dITP diphosphohydrolase
MPVTIVLATRNQGKVRELAAPLAAFGLRVVGLDAFPEVPEVEESGDTFAANARLKAEAAAKATGLAAVADDSGLEVDALCGAPGVRSARYWQPPDPEGGPEGGPGGGPGRGPDGAPALSQDERNIRKLLAALEDVPDVRRTARFCCAMCAVRPAGAGAGAGAGSEQEASRTLAVAGRWEGRILRTPRGSGGFGYDPVFLDPGLGLSAAEMPAEVKMRRSHRAVALAALLKSWPAWWQARRLLRCS